MVNKAKGKNKKAKSIPPAETAGPARSAGKAKIKKQKASRPQKRRDQLEALESKNKNAKKRSK
ncbi:MAG TPA: hypothetical protein PK753_04745 [Ignavibacteria bacterium]|nr:hypothetical protein [Ignavibacteria bacterium]